MTQVEKVEEYVNGILKADIPPSLFYHNLSHTLDVTKAAMELAREEGITNENDLLLLHTAALLHDCGYTKSYANHEDEGCRLAEKVLPGMGFSEAQIHTICEMIMKTKLPSTPQTILEKILCDADLDYLGRDDFYELGDKLYKELLGIKKISNKKEWDEMQVRFLESHHYWTQSAINTRAKKKAENLETLKTKVQA